MINVTKTFLPPQGEYQAILKQAWESGWMTNRGVLVNELESKLKKYLQTKNIITTTNGTLPLQIAIKALNLSGEIITTPFSYVATTSSIVWEGCTPIFVDIHPDYLTIDESKIEAAITNKTSALLVTHVYGNPCDIDSIESISLKYNLKVIYDAAHCFGVKYKGQSIFNFGDVSTCSFHATKLFHTGEGGALFCKPEYFERMFSHHNFGHQGKEHISGLGINAKMSEPQAAMGLSVLGYIEDLIGHRKTIVQAYNFLFKKSVFRTIDIRPDSQWNYSYYPLIFPSESQLKTTIEKLENNYIYPRRYFYPSLNTLNFVKYQACPISEDISSRILCLPIFHDLSLDDVNKIAGIINS